MAIKTCTGVTGRPYVHVEVRLSQSATITATGLDAPLVTNATGDVTGAYSITLWANNDLTPNGTYYTVTEYLGTTDNTFTIQVPQTAGPFTMPSILVTAPTASPSPNHVSTLIVDTTAAVGSLTVTAGETGIDTAAAGVLEIGGDNATSVEIGPANVLVDASGNVAARSFTAGNSPYAATALASATGGVIGDFVYFPPPSGGDDTTALQGIINVALAREFIFQPNANYSISAGLNPAANGQRFYVPASTTITQATWGLPWFEVRNFTDVVIDCPGLLTSTQPRVKIFGGGYDGTGSRLRCAGVYGYQCDRLRVPRLRVNNAVTGITLRGNTDNTTLTAGVEIGTVTVSNVDWGLLYGQQQGLHWDHIEGSVAFSQDFPHLIYATSVTAGGKSKGTVGKSARCTGTGTVNTTSAGAVNTAVPATITPASMTNIVPAMTLSLDIDGAHGTAETIVVIAVNTGAGTFTANVVNNHTGGVKMTTDNHAYAIKDESASLFGKLIADGCGGMLTTDDMTDCTYEQLLGYNLTGLCATGSIFGQGSVGPCDRNRFGFVHLAYDGSGAFANESPILWGTGSTNTDNTFDDVQVRPNHATTGNFALSIRGTRTKLNHVKVVSVGAGHPIGVEFLQGTGHTLADLETVACQFGFEINAANVSVDFLPELQDTTNLIAPGLVSSGANPKIKTRNTRFTQGFSGAGRTPDLTVADYWTWTVSSGAAWTINSPINSTDGAELTIELANTSGGAIATPTYGATFAHAGGVAPTPPGTLKSRLTRYRYNATKVLWMQCDTSTADL